MFVEEGRLLLLERQRSASVLRLIDLHQENRDVWSLRVPLSAADLLFDGASSEWRLLGWNEDRDIVSAAGTIGVDGVREERWKTPVEDIDNLEALSVSRGEVLALETQRRSRFPVSGPSWWLAAMVQPSLRAESRFWTVSQNGSVPFITSRLDLRCRGASAGDEGTMCTAGIAMERAFGVAGEHPPGF